MVLINLISDTHIGAATTDIDQIKRIANDFWAKNPCILLGDMIDIGLYKGMAFHQKYQPQEQVNLVEEIFKPLDVKAYCLGNHSMRIYESTGLNVYETIFHMKPTNYFRAGSKLVYFNHGKSAAQNIFLEHHHLLEWVRADVIALGHNHSLASIPHITGDGKIVHLVRTGAFIGHANYAKRAGLGPHLQGWATYETEKHIIRCWYVDIYGEVQEI